MTSKSVLYALAVIVLTGGMAVAAYAEAPVMGAYDRGDSAILSQPELGVGQTFASEIREPVETGSIPDRPEDSYDVRSNLPGDEATAESGGQMFRPGVDLGP